MLRYRRKRFPAGPGAALSCLAVLACLVPGCARGPALVREETRLRSLRLRETPVRWERVAQFDFECPSLMADFLVVEGGWEIRDGALWAVEGERNRAILLDEGFHPYMRVEAAVTNYASGGLLGDITILLDSAPGRSFFSAGYALTTGSFWNNCTSFYRGGTVIANTSRSPLRTGRRNLVAVEFRKGHIRYEMNGERLLEAWDENPLPSPGHGWTGIRTWATLMRVEELAIYRGEPVDE